AMFNSRWNINRTHQKEPKRQKAVGTLRITSSFDDAVGFKILRMAFEMTGKACPINSDYFSGLGDVAAFELSLAGLGQGLKDASCRFDNAVGFKILRMVLKMTGEALLTHSDYFSGLDDVAAFELSWAGLRQGLKDASCRFNNAVGFKILRMVLKMMGKA